jgi:hypothetical protein
MAVLRGSAKGVQLSGKRGGGDDLLVTAGDPLYKAAAAKEKVAYSMINLTVLLKKQTYSI